MKKLVMILVLLALVVVGAVFYLPSLVSTERLVATVSQQVESHTGRRLNITGDVSLSVFPTLAVELGGVELSNPSWATGPSMVTMESLRLKLQLMPLLSKQVVVDELELVKPILWLEQNKNGEGNWQFAAHRPARWWKGESLTASAEPAAASNPLSQLTISRLEIVEGTLNWQDHASAKAISLHALNLSASVPDLDETLTATLKADYREQPLSADVTLTSPQSLLDGKNAVLRLDSSLAGNRVQYDGGLTLKNDGPLLQGTVDAALPALRQLLAVADVAPTMPEPALTSASLKGGLHYAGQSIQLSQASLMLDSLELDGDLSINLAGAKPMIEGQLEGKDLDISPYVSESQNHAAAQGFLGLISSAMASNPPQGWSRDPIDLSGLKAVNAKLSLKADSLRQHKILLSKPRLKLAIQQGALTANLPKLGMFDGMGDFDLTANAAGQWNLNGTLNAVQIEPLLQALEAPDKITGTTQASFQLASQGKSMANWMSALSGKGNVKFLDGKLKGLDLAQLSRELKSAFNPAQDTASRSTDFAELGGTFTITQGVLSTQDLAMLAPFARLTGQGTADISAQQLDFRIRPKLVNTSKGQGAAMDRSGVTIPLRISGPFHDPKIQPDAESLVKDTLNDPEAVQKLIEDPGAAKEQIKAIGDQLKGLF